MKVTKVALGLGSNLGNREANIFAALELLQQCGFTDQQVSSLVSSEPVDCPEGSGEFLNGAATGVWKGAARDLMEVCQRIEKELGRPEVREINSPRPVDLDILLFGDEIVSEEDLVVPHPRMSERDFVMKPLAEIAKDWIIPDSGITVESKAEELK